MAINAAKLVTMHDDARLREIVDALRARQRRRPERRVGVAPARRPAARARRRHRPDARAARPRRGARLPRLLPRRASGGARDARSSGCASSTRGCTSPATATATSPRKSGRGLRRDPRRPRRHPLRRDEHAAQGVLPRRATGRSLGVPFVMGVGGSIDVVAGITRRAPAGWQRLGLEWLYRLLQEPRRMFRRYAVTNARFAFLVGRALLTRRIRHHERGTRGAALDRRRPWTPR